MTTTKQAREALSRIRATLRKRNLITINQVEQIETDLNTLEAYIEQEYNDYDWDNAPSLFSHWREES